MLRNPDGRQIAITFLGANLTSEPHGEDLASDKTVAGVTYSFDVPTQRPLQSNPEGMDAPLRANLYQSPQHLGRSGTLVRCIDELILGAFAD